jgi:glycosyltransferase involved in cell wall biosynthesis
VRRILVDCRFAHTFSGLGRYTREIATHMVNMAESERYILLVRSPRDPWLTGIRGKCDIVPTDIPHYSPEEQTKLPAVMRDLHPDLLFSPHFNVPFFYNLPFVAAIHDLILHTYPNDAAIHRKLAYRILMRNTVKRASHLIAISGFVKDELKRTYGNDAHNKTSVVLQGVDDRYVPQSVTDITHVRDMLGIKRDYFLYVGNAKEHKNVRMLIDSFMESGIHDAELLLVTNGPEAANLEPLPPNVRFVRDVSDDNLPALYGGARAVVTASLYEGFCLPAAEALAVGVPLIASNRTAIPEVASGRALLIEPTREAFAAAFRSPPLAKPAYVRNRWKDTAAETRQILLNVLSGT